MKTLMMLMAAHDGKPVIPAEIVAKEYFDLAPRVFLRKVADGQIRLPIIRFEDSQKSAKGVHIEDLARFLDERRTLAQNEMMLLQD